MILHPLREAPLFDQNVGVGPHASYMARMLIVIMHLLGFGMALIHEWSGHNQKTIDRWIKRFETTGDVQDEERSGRPHITNPTTDAAIVSVAEEEKFITPRVIRTKVKVNVSNRTVRRILNEAGLFGRVARFSWPLTQDHINKRLSFARTYGKWNKSQWHTTLFCDECHVWLDNPSQIWVQRPEDAAYMDEYMIHRPPNRIRVSIWAGFSASGVTCIHVIKGNLTAEKLVEILDDEVPQYCQENNEGEMMNLLQDNSPIHTAKVVRDWLATNEVGQFDFPPYSPDLNPMENIWAWLKRELDHDLYENAQELEAAILNHWSNIDPRMLVKLAESMPARLEAVKVQRGFKTKY